MAIAALLATASSVTATLYASEGLTSALADVGQFPTVFGTTSRLGPHGGLWITTVATLLFVNVFDLGALASIGSAVSLAVFVLVGVAAIRLRHTIGANLAILLAGVLFSIVVLVVFAVDTYSNDPKAFWTMILLPVLALVLDAGWKHRDAGTAPAAGARISETGLEASWIAANLSCLTGGMAERCFRVSQALAGTPAPRGPRSTPEACSRHGTERPRARGPRSSSCRSCAS